jgi:hypothetical protein
MRRFFKKSCEKCGHWRVSAHIPDEGTCRRYPPALIPSETDPVVDGAQWLILGWPDTFASDYCGEWNRW